MWESLWSTEEKRVMAEGRHPCTNRVARRFCHFCLWYGLKATVDLLVGSKPDLQANLDGVRLTGNDRNDLNVLTPQALDER